MSSGTVYDGSMYGLVTSAGNLAQNSSEVRAMIRGTLRGADYIRQHPSETTSFLGKYVEPDHDLSSLLYAGLVQNLTSTNDVTTQWVQQLLKDARVSPSSVPAGVVDLGPLHEVQNQLKQPR